MKIVYMGTPDFAVPALDMLLKSDHEVGYVVSQPDKARDRGKKIKATPVKEKAMEFDIPVLQPEKIKDNQEFENILKEYAPDLIVVAAYGKIVPKNILEIPKYGCVNIHGSILPRWRGAAPIQRAIMEGDKETGVTLMYMGEGLDTGDMIDKVFVSTENKTSEDLHDELSVKGAELLMQRIDDFEAGTINAEKQDDDLTCYAPVLSKKEGIMDFSKPAWKLECEIRGLDPWPGAFTYMNGDIFKIWGASVLDKNADGEVGTIVNAGEEGIDIVTGEGILRATVIQVPGKKRMNVRDYIRGHKIEKGTKLGEK